ncbi:hypothetical protein NC651_027495 [Populus alba x Populus x berolinensis]|nr:hypothetical protein NC651_027495 [Populus alba x Populus x berolinensis]
MVATAKVMIRISSPDIYINNKKKITRKATSLRGQGSLPCYFAPGFTRKAYKNPIGAQQCGVAELDFDFRVSLYLERTQHDTDCCRSQETNDILG